MADKDRPTTRARGARYPRPAAVSALAPARVTHAWIGTLGILIFLLSTPMTIESLGSLQSGDSDSTPGTLVGLAVFFLFLAACGAWMAVDNIWRPRREAAVTLDERILALAEARAGRLTVDEVAVACRLSVLRSKAALDRLAAAGAAAMQATDGGILVYAFPGFLSDPEKREAKPL
jgi:hypothetical protein